VTLTMTIVAPWGVWQCADHRLIWIERGKVTDREDFSVKHVAVRCPDGVALITYSGIGALGRKLHVSDWLRELVRGENRRTVDGTLIRIREAATSDLARPAKAHGVVHWFVVGAFLQRRPWWAAITNQPGPPGSPILDHFETIAEPADNPPRRVVAGKGLEAISAEDWALLDRIKNRRPKRPEDYARVLADIHRRAKQSRHPARHAISEGCVTAYMPPIGADFKEGTGLQVLPHWHTPESEELLPPAPFVLFGIDTTETAKVLIQRMRAMQAGQPLSDEEANRLHDEALRRSIKPSRP
jgi:hypothetical protein